MRMTFGGRGAWKEGLSNWGRGDLTIDILRYVCYNGGIDHENYGLAPSKGLILKREALFKKEGKK